MASDEDWEQEVVAMLHDPADRAAVFADPSLGEADADSTTTTSIGSRIVLGSFLRLDESAQELFRMMAVLPEDVPVTMPALELILCSKEGIVPPLGRLQRMTLRKRVFR